MLLNDISLLELLFSDRLVMDVVRTAAFLESLFLCGVHFCMLPRRAGHTQVRAFGRQPVILFMCLDYWALGSQKGTAVLYWGASQASHQHVGVRCISSCLTIPCSGTRSPKFLPRATAALQDLGG